jgi:hypothetical protein
MSGGACEITLRHPAVAPLGTITALDPFIIQWIARQVRFSGFQWGASLDNFGAATA